MLYGVENPKITEDVVFDFAMEGCKHCTNDGFCTCDEGKCSFQKNWRCEVYDAQKLQDAIWRDAINKEE